MDDYKAELYFNPLFDYLRFYKEGKLTDCELRFQEDPSKEPIKAHAFILSNSSEYFKNVLTAKTDESNTGVIVLQDNPSIIPLMPKVIEFLYSGRLEYTEDELMPLLHIADVYCIPSLQKRISYHLQNSVNPSSIYTYSNQCYQCELESELMNQDHGLVVYFAQFFDKLKIEDLTKALDVVTFCIILKKLSLKPDQMVNYLDQFIGEYKEGEYQIDEIDKKACGELFNKGDKSTRVCLSKGKHRWLPDNYL